VSLHRRVDDPEPERPAAHLHEHRRVAAAGRLGTGTLACPRCDAPVALGRAAPSEQIGCPFCSHTGAVRDFLSLAGPPRPARVAVLVTMPA
jgi:uncharacterized paraquat-inducible protein A